MRWRAWRRKSPCVGVVPEGDKDLAPAKASPFIELPSDATDSSSFTTFLETEGDRLSLKASPARSIAVRSEWPQNRKRNHPRHHEMDTSRISEVKAPLHNGTPRSHDFGTASAPRSRSHAVQIRTVSLVVPIREHACRPDPHRIARRPVLPKSPTRSHRLP